MDQALLMDQGGSGSGSGSGWIRMDQDGSGLDEIKTLIYP
jgi:hypothetical protein